MTVTAQQNHFHLLNKTTSIFFLDVFLMCKRNICVGMQQRLSKSASKRVGLLKTVRKQTMQSRRAKPVHISQGLFMAFIQRVIIFKGTPLLALGLFNCIYCLVYCFEHDIYACYLARLENGDYTSTEQEGMHKHDAHICPLSCLSGLGLMDEDFLLEGKCRIPESLVPV